MILKNVYFRNHGCRHAFFILYVLLYYQQRLKKEISDTFDARQVLTYRSQVEGVDDTNDKVRV